MRWGLALSIALHAALGALLLPVWQQAGPAAEAPLVEVELVQQAPTQEGAATAEAAQPPPVPDSPAPASPPDGGLPPPTSASPPGRTGSPPVNLGDADHTQNSLSVTGENIVPPAPDSVFRNRPPSYPSMRRGAARRARSAC